MSEKNRARSNESEFDYNNDDIIFSNGLIRPKYTVLNWYFVATHALYYIEIKFLAK